MGEFKYSLISTACFLIAPFCSILIFVGCFTTRAEVMKEMLFDRFIILSLGVLVPLTTIIAIISLIFAIRKREKLILLPIILGILSIIGTFTYYSVTFSYILELI